MNAEGTVLLANRMHASPHDVCRCGHERAAHEHYRGGTECSLCSPTTCPRFRRQGIVSRLRHILPLGTPPARGARSSINIAPAPDPGYRGQS
jgi:hypothetical protein